MLANALSHIAPILDHVVHALGNSLVQLGLQLLAGLWSVGGNAS